MWEAIESNKRRSWLLIGLMGALLVLLGSLAGATLDPEAGAVWGALVALAVWGVLLAIAFTQGERVLLLGAGAREITHDDAPRLWNVVEEMTIAAGLPRMPAVYIVEDQGLNAFAVGRNPDRAAVAVTSGLLARLNRDELQGVVAHEIGHIVNRDVRFMTIAGVMVGAIVLLADIFLRHLWYTGGRVRRRGPSDPRVQMAVVGAAILVALLSPLLARLLYFACSRRREYLADASAALYTRYPEGLASALEKIATRPGNRKRVNRALVPMYIVNPLQAYGQSGLFSTHPPTEKRIRILRNMAGCGFGDYEAAYRKVMGGRDRLFGVRTLASAERHVPAREPSPEERREEAVERAREVGRLLDRLSGFLLLTCPCGVGIHVPPDHKGDVIPCPRCGREHAVPKNEEGQPVAGGKAAAADPAREEPMRYHRKGKGWESFRCRCGRVIQLSPKHAAPVIRCSRCKRTIEIAVAEPQR